MKRLTPEQEDRLLDDCLTGKDPDRFIRHYWRLVESTVEKIIRKRFGSYTRETVENLRNDVFVRLLDHDCRRLRQYDRTKGRSLSSWIFMVTVQTVVRELDDKSMDSISSENKRDEFLEDIGYGDKIGNSTTIEAVERLIEENIKKLPPRDQLVLRMELYEGLSLKEIAFYLDLSETAASAAKSRAYKRLTDEILKDKYLEILKDFA